MIDLVGALVSYDTYPHVDMRYRGREAAGPLGSVLSGTSLRTQIRKVPLLVSPIAQATDHDPMRALQRRASARAARAGLHRVSVLGSFAYSDVTRACMSVLVIHDDARAAEAADVLRETIADIEANAGQFVVARDDPATAAGARRPRRARR